VARIEMVRLDELAEYPNPYDGYDSTTNGVSEVHCIHSARRQ
jgi:hypothetical protein